MFSLLLALHGAMLWLILQPTMLTLANAHAGALDVVLLDAPAPPSEAEPDVAPQALPLQVNVSEPSVIEPSEVSAEEPNAANTISPDAPGKQPPSTGASGEPELKAPEFEADYLANPAPAYPALSRQLREQGVTTLRVRVAADGNPLAIEIERSSGYERLDRAAIFAVERWRFVPARRGSVAVAAWVIVPVRFNLRR
ncbi:MAG: energy transducer TonB [Gammaproteobacteria bacterium]